MSFARHSASCLLGFLLAAASPSHSAAHLDRAGDVVGETVRLIDARLALMPDIAAAKWVAHLPVTDSAREQVVIAAAGEAAEHRGLARKPVERLFVLQMEAARNRQERLIELWQREGGGPTHAPSLSQSLRPRLDRLTVEFIEALVRAVPYLANAPLDSLSEALPAERWTADERTRLATALKDIHFDTGRSVRRTRMTGILRIGVPADYAPFAWEAGAELVGADIDLTTALAAQLNLTPVYVRSSWAGLLADLEEDRFDLAAGGISVTPARQARAGFSATLVTGGKTAIGRCSDKARFTSLQRIDQRGVRVVENPGGTNEAFARRHLTEASLAIHTDNVSVFNELLEGRADVMLTDDLEVARIARHESRLCRLFDDVFEPADKALLLPPESEWKDLVDPVVAPAVTRGDYRHWLEMATAR